MTPNTQNIHQKLILLAAPLIIGNILQQMYNAVDVLIIGRLLGQADFAATGVAGSVMNLFLFLIVGACTGLSIIFAQFYGARDLNGFRNEHFLALVFGLSFSVCIGILGNVFLEPLLEAIRTPEELQGPASAYLRIILLGLPVTFLYNFYGSMLRSVGSTFSSLLMLLAAVLCNIALDIGLIAGAGMGIAGAAAATVLAQLLSAVLCIVYLRIHHRELCLSRRNCVFKKPLLVKTIRFSITTSLHQAGLYIGKLVVQGAINSAGTAMIAGFTAAARIEGFANSFGDSGSAATSVLVGQSVGAGRREETRKTVRASFTLLALLGIICALIMYLTADTTCAFMLGEKGGDAFFNAVAYTRLISVFYIFCFTGNAFTGFYEGSGQVLLPIIGAFSHITFRAIMSALFVQRFGLNAVAAATGIGWIGANTFWLIYLRLRGRLGFID